MNCFQSLIAAGIDTWVRLQIKRNKNLT